MTDSTRIPGWGELAELRSQIHHRGFGVVVTRLHGSPQTPVLVEALPALVVRAQVLADPCPEFGPAAGCSLAEVHEVVAAGHALDLHLAEGAALARARWNGWHGDAPDVRET